MDNNTSLMLIDNNASFEMDHVDASHNNPMALARPSTDDGLLLPQPGIRRRRRKKSMVWEHFTIETTRPGSSKACCKHCRKSFAYITGQKLAGTSHLKCHILLAMYFSEKQKLSTFIGEIPGQVNLTVDLWTSNQSVGYAFATGHFIDKDWNLTHRLLNVAVVPSPDSDFALNQSDWNLERRLCSLTVGQSVVNKSSIENLRCCLSARNQHVMNGQLLLGNCYARLLSSMAHDVLGAEDL
ncbi:hypothetical protein HID58_071109 [Brassica napus]|uniref:BED-type domain-containing protein n=1 Tax=Brassica napus TaxID=3708 RepID=A0ABQ7Z0M5_BRANA|nr:hypothetical protein HID58_071109 [Brassica napus]